MVPGGWELVLILLVVLVVFGAKRLPDSARALGRSMRILKAETKGLREDDDASSRTKASVVRPVEPGPQPGTQPYAQPYTQQHPAQPAPPQPAQPYAGQQLYDAQGRPVQVPGQPPQG